jgi:histone-lysine N-methyltransferase EZH2
MGRNYLYSREIHGEVRDSTLDAARVGNETRFLNYATTPANNCDCKVLIVDNDLRIGLFATEKIAKGAELLLDYGEKYWQLS